MDAARSREIRRLRIFRRVPDTTLRDLVMLLALPALRAMLRRQVRNAHRRTPGRGYLTSATRSVSPTTARWSAR
jgi:hypothetical protein